MSLDEESDDPYIVKCLTKRMGVPRYVLGASVIAIIVFCMYIMVAFFHARSSKSRAYAVSILMSCSTAFINGNNYIVWQKWLKRVVVARTRCYNTVSCSRRLVRGVFGEG